MPKSQQKQASAAKKLAAATDSQRTPSGQNMSKEETRKHVLAKVLGKKSRKFMREMLPWCSGQGINSDEKTSLEQVMTSSGTAVLESAHSDQRFPFSFLAVALCCCCCHPLPLPSLPPS
eukprot:1643008-Rhodomonas_salina.1